MKNIQNIILVLAGMLLLTFMSCEEITDINIDPNNPTDVPAENLLTAAQYNLANTMWSRGLNAEWSMLMVQHWAQNEYCEESRYTVDGNNFNAEWVEIYADVLKELNTATTLISANEGLPAEVRTNQLAIISIIEVYTNHLLTDLYGDMPYSQALNPLDYPNPAYDKQSDIYTGLVSKLQAALASLASGAGSFDSGDVIYGGNTGLWEKFGNSLLLRIAMRMSDVDETTARSVINGISGDFISSNAENALFTFDSNSSVANPLFVDNTINTRDDFCVTDVLVEQLVAMGDPRLDVYASVTNSGTYVGMPYGLADADAFALNPTTSRPGAVVRTATAPAILMDHAEVSFLLAEAYQRGILSGDAAQAYNDGVTASMAYWGITDATALAGYLTANPYDVANWKQSVGLQKWLAFYANGTQAWAEWRRLDYPVLAIPAAATNDVIPLRLPYPISEQTNNETSLNEVVNNGNPNDLSTPMWWDVN